MGCHTWFNNRLSDIPNEHLNILKMKALSNINGQRILKCKDYDEWVDTVSKWHIDEDAKKKFHKWLKSDYGRKTVEPHYSNIKPQIIIEDFISG